MPIIEIQLVPQLENVRTEVLPLSFAPGYSRLDLCSGPCVVIEGGLSGTRWGYIPNHLF